MPTDVTSGSFAATAIMALFWWTALSPLALLAIAVICASRLRLRATLLLFAVAPPILALLPIVAMQNGLPRGGAVAAVLLEATATGLAVAALALARRHPEGAATGAAAALALGIVGGLAGSAVLVAALIVV